MKAALIRIENPQTAIESKAKPFCELVSPRFRNSKKDKAIPTAMSIPAIIRFSQ